MSLKTLPPGLETLYSAFYDPSCKSSFAALILAVHSSVIRTTHFRLKLAEDSELTELLPKTWLSDFLVDKNEKVSARFVALPYVNPVSGDKATVVVQECAVDGLVLVLLEDQKKDKKGEDLKGAALDVEYYVNCDAVNQSPSKPARQVYNSDAVWELESKIKKSLFPDEKDAREVTPWKEPDPYGSNLTDEQKQKIQYEKDMKELKRLREEREEAKRSGGSGFGGGIIMPEPGRQLPMFPDPTRGLGRGDLDPFGALGGIGGGMLMDPRGFRRPQMPGGIVPGARFDPFGPPGSGGFGGVGGTPPRFPGGYGGLPFGAPNPDHERMHGYDDMFS